MKRTSSPSSSSRGQSDELIKISTHKVQKLIKKEICRAVKEKEARLDAALKAIEQRDYGDHFENSVKRLEDQLMTVTKKAEAIYAYMTKKNAKQQKEALLCPDLKIIREKSDSATGASWNVGPADSTSMEFMESSRELSEIMESTNEAVKKMREDSTALKAAITEVMSRPAPQGTSKSKGSASLLTKASTKRAEKKIHEGGAALKVAITDIMRQPGPAPSAISKSKESTKQAEKKIREDSAAFKVVITNVTSLPAPAPPAISKSKESTKRVEKKMHEDTAATVPDLTASPPPPAPAPAAIANSEGPSRPVEKPEGALEEENKVKEQHSKSSLKKELKELTLAPVSPSCQDEDLNNFVHLVSVKTEFSYPPLPPTPPTITISLEAVLYHIPQKPALKLTLIRKPAVLCALWNVHEKDPQAPPMQSYIVFITTEKYKGSNIFPGWTVREEAKAEILPMYRMYSDYKRGHKLCVAVQGRDVFGRYGPYSNVVVATMPED